MAKSALANKITGTLIVITVLAVIITTFLMLLITRQLFTDYIRLYDQATLDQWLPVVSEYYASKGPEGLQEFLGSSPAGNSMGQGMGKRRGGAMMPMKSKLGQRLIVTDMQMTVVADSSGLLTGKKVQIDLNDASSEIIKVDNEPRGVLYIVSPLGTGLASLENDFISKLTFNAGFIALFMGVFALLLGLVLGKRVSAPLGELSTAIHQVAQGQLDKRVDLTGDQEFVQLANDFNKMAGNLEEAEARRRRLTADISHELRTPLTLLRGQLEGMQAGSIPDDNENVTLLLDEVIRLSRLVKDLDNLSLVENQALSITAASFALSELMDRLHPVSFAAQDKGIVFTIEVENDISQITADQDRLLQILLNLLANAVHHAGSGGIVTLSLKRDQGRLLFSITDNGPGISERDLPHVFDRFYRVDDSRSRLEGGMGLGLAIARGYVEAHGGKIWAESRPGAGTTFSFTLPQ
ncbi:MAG: HAMP domain-containing protein [Syntrophomonadaceae bacterium]|jgi:signal transduction histidine kinase|nr:HAMP domain-containing protein [Syntrophomonadaceae bacterium]